MGGHKLFEKHLREMTGDPRIRQMKNYEQHTVSTTYDHVCHVARMSNRIVQRMPAGLRRSVSEQELLRGALLHDYYLYDFRENPMSAYRHGTSHAELALENASEEFDLTEREKGIIYSHMWPLNLTHLPRSKEAWIVTLADKICAIQEMVFHYHFDEDAYEEANALHTAESE